MVDPDEILVISREGHVFQWFPISSNLLYIFSGPKFFRVLTFRLETNVIYLLIRCLLAAFKDILWIIRRYFNGRSDRSGNRRLYLRVVQLRGVRTYIFHYLLWLWRRRTATIITAVGYQWLFINLLLISFATLIAFRVDKLLEHCIIFWLHLLFIQVFRRGPS